MKDRDDFETISSHPVRNHVGCAGYDELSSTGHSTWAPEIGKVDQTFDCGQKGCRNAGRRVGVVASDVSSQLSKVINCPSRPDDAHRRGALRSSFRPHERSQVETDS